LTKILEIDENNIDFEKIQLAADVLKNGGLVVFPTETVYGLGAAAANQQAVKGIFQAKGRPSDNPLIVHVSNRKMIEELVKNPDVLNDDRVVKITDVFWPGPLTIIFEKSEAVCKEVCAGLDTVGIRMPENKVALALIEEAGIGIAAPSANTSGRPSPTRPEHVIEDMNGRVDIIISSGGCSVGVESTVLDMTSIPPTILRPGGVTRERLEQVLGERVQVSGEETKDLNIPKAPGMKYRHYAPKGQMTVFDRGENLSDEKFAARMHSLLIQALQMNKKPILLISSQLSMHFSNEYEKYIKIIGNLECKETFAEEIFAALRYCDECGAEVILTEGISRDGIGDAVMNRLIKASGRDCVIVE